MNFSSTPSTFMLIVPLILSMVALTDFRKDFPRMMEVYLRGSISMTMKLAKVEETWNSINTLSATP
jgi:alkylhydroperoxidase/carboxymuconolactone decarboxylase family protein YurZ